MLVRVLPNLSLDSSTIKEIYCNLQTTLIEEPSSKIPLFNWNKNKTEEPKYECVLTVIIKTDSNTLTRTFTLYDKCADFLEEIKRESFSYIEKITERVNRSLNEQVLYYPITFLDQTF